MLDIIQLFVWDIDNSLSVEKNRAKPESKRVKYQNSRAIFNRSVFLLQKFIFSQVDRSVRVSAGNIKKAFDQEVAVVEGRDIPMIRLDKLFGLKKERGLFLTEEEMQSVSYKLKAELMVIAKKENSSSVGLIVDEMISEQDIVVKPLRGILKKTKGFEGVTFLGDGRPALILDVSTLI